MEPVYELSPAGETLQVFEDRVRLTPKGVLGFFAKGTTAQKDIPFSSISAVEYKPGGFVTGYIQFSIKGGNEETGWIGDAVYDENSITFGGALDGGDQYNKVAEEIVEFINGKIGQIETPSAHSGDSLADELAKLSKLHSDGVLSDEEFSAAKKRLLG